MVDQAKIVLNRKTNNLYEINNLDVAAKNLTSKGGFKLYMFYIKHRDNYPLIFTPQDFLEWASLEDNDFNEALNDLITHGFLTPDENDEDSFEFSDEPQQENSSVIERVIFE